MSILKKLDLKTFLLFVSFITEYANEIYSSDSNSIVLKLKDINCKIQNNSWENYIKNIFHNTYNVKFYYADYNYVTLEFE